MTFKTIRETVKSEGIPETALRRMVRDQGVPGFYAGNRFYINVEAFREQLSAKPAPAQM